MTNAAVAMRNGKAMRPDASHFDALPDDATVSIRIFAVVADEGVSTLWGKAQRQQPGFPKLIRRGPKCTRIRVGDIRNYVAGRPA